MRKAPIGQRWCHWIDPDQDITIYGGYVPSTAFESCGVFYPQLDMKEEDDRHWLWGNTLEEAQNRCNQSNSGRGLTQEEVEEIVNTALLHGKFNSPWRIAQTKKKEPSL